MKDPLGLAGRITYLLDISPEELATIRPAPILLAPFPAR
jgi:hypothetical protein